MAFPVVAGSIATEEQTAVAQPTINLPGSIAAGDLLLIFLHFAGDDDSITLSGWTQLFHRFFGASDLNLGADDRHYCWYRQADGTEGGSIASTSADPTTGKTAALAWRITGAELVATQAPEASPPATNVGSTTPDPPDFSPTGGAKDYLWLWVGGWQNEQTSPPAGNPTNYASNIIGASTGTGGIAATNGRAASASRELNAASEDPPSWTISASGPWAAYTFAIHPAAEEEEEPPTYPGVAIRMGWPRRAV